MGSLKVRRGFESGLRLDKPPATLAALLGAAIFMSGSALAQSASSPGTISFNLSASVAAVEQRNRELEAEVERLRKDLAAARSLADSPPSGVDAEAQHLKARLAEPEPEAAATREALATARQDVAAARADLAARNHSIAQLEEALAASREAVSEREQRIRELEAQTRSVLSGPAANPAAVATSEAEGGPGTPGNQRDALEAELDRSRIALAARDKRIELLQEALDAALASIASSARRADKFESDFNALRTEMAEAERERLEQEREVRSVQTLAPAAPEKSFPTLRQELYEQIRTALGAEAGAQTIDQRFIVQADGWFERDSDLFSESGLRDMRHVAELLGTAAPGFPGSVDWILRVDAHTDDRPPTGGGFADNDALSAARAQAVVRFLVDHGIPSGRVSGTGYAGKHPIDSRSGSEARQRNRRVELRLAER
ncbi:MAG: OmpA family protein [Zoogloeaceae bacterium]|nr:OmpA family protein [Zoogloeaceae bacterium]